MLHCTLPRCSGLIGLLNQFAYRPIAGFVAPEVVRGKPHSKSMDVYSLGVLLFTMLVGKKPFDTATTHSLRYANMSITSSPRLKDERQA